MKFRPEAREEILQALDELEESVEQDKLDIMNAHVGCQCWECTGQMPDDYVPEPPPQLHQIRRKAK